MRSSRAMLCALALTIGACQPSAATTENLPPGTSLTVRREHVQEVTIHTVELSTGRGPLRIAIHGGPGFDHTYLRPWLDPLGVRGRLVYVDLRGHGHSSVPSDVNSYTIA